VRFRPAAALTLLVLLVPAAAVAAQISGTSRADVLTGTPGADVLDGKAGNDVLRGLAGGDLLLGGPGSDRLAGGPGADRIAAFDDAARDTVQCGPGRDIVNADRLDTVAGDCELLTRQLSTDTTTAEEAQHATEVEPDSFAWSSTVVSAYQAGRYAGGGAAAIGFSTSADGGRTWRSGLLPGLTPPPALATPSDRVSDPAVAYDSLHGAWLISSLGISSGAWSVLVSRSVDGLSWSAPVAAASGQPGSVDKEWIACDNWPSSPFRGRCYLSYLDAAARQIVTRFSVDAGLTWSAPAGTSAAVRRPGVEVNGAQPLPRPDGSLVVVYVLLPERPGSGVEQTVLAARSDDGGASFRPEVQVARVSTASGRELRTPPLPSADVDASGRLYAVWQSCAAVQSCGVERLFLATSSDGLAWSPPAPVAVAPATSDQILPGLAVDPAAVVGPRGTGLAVVYYTVLHSCLAVPTCAGLDVWLSSSANGGATWSEPQRLSAESMELGWLASTGDGFFLGDYVSLSFANGRPVAVFALAAEPVRGRLREAISALAPGARR
jgi:hypothetical protein